MRRFKLVVGDLPDVYQNTERHAQRLAKKLAKKLNQKVEIVDTESGRLVPIL